MTTANATPASRAGALPWLGWLLTAALLVYAALVHRGIGPLPRSLESHWYSPNASLLNALQAGSLNPVLESAGWAVALLAVPALIVAVAAFVTTRSALARMLGAASVIAVAVCVYYGVEAPGVWSFFHWRWSGSILLFSLCLGAALTAPLLAESWKRHGWPLRLLLYLPVFAAAVVFERNVTGTDDSLVFAISPWPVVQVFGLEVFASAIALLLFGVALGLWVASLGRERSTSHRILLSSVAAFFAAAIPTLGVWLGSEQSLLPFRAGAALLATTALIALVSFAVAAASAVRRGVGGLAARASIWALAGLLVGLPLMVGQVLTRLDYTTTREVQAQQLIAALERHYQETSVYPDSLEELVAAGELTEVPRPRIGFSFLSNQDFLYQGFGTSYVLEFSAPRWIQCAYNPPYLDEYGEEDEEDLEDLGGAWSCPSKPPELW